MSLRLSHSHGAVLKSNPTRRSQPRVRQRLHPLEACHPSATELSKYASRPGPGAPGPKESTSQSLSAKIEKTERRRRSTFFATANQTSWKIQNLQLHPSGKRERRNLPNPAPNQDAIGAPTLHESDR